MKTPAFWNEKPGILACLLAPLGFVYGAITAWRMKKSGTALDLPVLCVGNFTAGGTGKTPVVAHIVELLAGAGEKPFILSRGYGGKLLGPVRVDLALHASKDCGDEPLLLARHAPTIICVDRLAGAKLAVASGATVLVMDDGLQNPGLEKDFSIAVVDGAVGFGNGFCVPAGPLRASVKQQLPYVDLVMVIGGQDTVMESTIRNAILNKPALTASIQASQESADKLRSMPLLAFAGIGRPEKFFETLRALKLDVREARAFPDHHPYLFAEIEELTAAAKASDLKLVTTEKDAVRLPCSHADIAVLPVHLAVSETTLLATLQSAIARKRLAKPKP